MIGVLFLKSGAPHQSQAPASEFRGDRRSVFKIRGRPISVRSCVFKSGAPHQSQAPASEFRGDRSSVFKIRGAPSVPGSSLGVQR